METNRDYCYTVNHHIEMFIQVFLEKYFGDEDGNVEQEFSILEDDSSDMLKQTLFIADMYFSLSDMYTALRYDIPYDVLEKWYWLKVESYGKDVVVPNLKNYYLMNKK